jgi:ABC-type sugar transport system ATPase subunit
MSGNKPLLRVVGISKRFPGVLALDHVSMEVMPGKVHALVGENGAGKSTLIKILSGALHQDSGDVFINGQRVEITDPHRAVQLGISAIFQDPCLVPSLSVEDNVLLGREPRNRLPGFINKRNLREQARALLAQLGLDLDPTRKVEGLSHSYQQLVAIAKALSVDARLIIMDEPSSALTAQELDYLFAVIRDLRARGISVIYVSHRLEEVFTIADAVSVLRDGQYIGTRPVSATSHAELVRMIVGREIEMDIHPRRGPSSQVTLSVEGISRQGAFSDVTFIAHRGEVVAITGLVGSGRSDVARAIFGAEPIDRGEIRIRDQRRGPQSPRDAVRMGVSMVPEDRKKQGFIPCMSVKSNITLSNLRHYCRWGLVQEAAENPHVMRHMERLRITPPDLQRKVMYLSGGNQQKVVLAKALETEAEILILDEPTAGIDVGTKAEIRALISELAEQGHTILLISSEIPEVMALADRILVMHGGRLTGELRQEEANAERILRLAMGQK